MHNLLFRHSTRKVHTLRPAGQVQTPSRNHFHRASIEIVHCATRGENELFQARVRCSARVVVEGARDGDDCCKHLTRV